MTAQPCLYCGALAVDAHHVCGRLAPDGQYLDPLLTIALCHRCHVAEHQALRRLGLDFPRPGTDLLQHRRLRIAAVANRCRDLGRPFVVEPRSAGGLAALLLNTNKSFMASSRVEHRERV
jgi:hypothetical protein